MHNGLWIVVAEISLFERSGQNLENQGFQERAVLRRYCLSLSGAELYKMDFCRIKYRAGSNIRPMKLEGQRQISECRWFVR